MKAAAVSGEGGYPQESDQPDSRNVEADQTELPALRSYIHSG